MSSGVKITLYCEHVSKRHVHCNKYTAMNIDINETPREAIRRSNWAIVENEVRCEEHHD